MAILVLGGSGFLGAHVVAALERAGRPVLSASRRPRRAPGARGASEAAGALAVDLAEAGAGSALVERATPEAVVVLCALSRVGDCERDPALARRLNAEAPREVAAACARRGARLVHVSTDLVFGGEPPRASGYRESDAPDPRHVYGRTKADGEASVLAEHPAALVVRLPLLFGASFGRGLGASDGLLAALDAGAEPTLFVDEWRTPLDAGVAARALVELVGGDAAGLLHVGGPERVTRLELGRAVLEGAGRAADLGRLRPGRRADAGMADRPADVSLDSARARELLATRLPAIRDALAGADPQGGAG